MFEMVSKKKKRVFIEYRKEKTGGFYKFKDDFIDVFKNNLIIVSTIGTFESLERSLKLKVQ